MSATVTEPPARIRATQAPLQHTLRLENGDHLTRAEFERRYARTPEKFKAELIEGVVYVASPLRVQVHSTPHAHLVTWLGVYCAGTPQLQVGDNATVRLDVDNEAQPDAFLRIEDAYGGQSHISADDYIEGAPELVVEIAASSASYDLHDKLNVYRRAGVQEYIVWRTEDRALDWFRLREGKYEMLAADAQGTIRSEIFPGLNLVVPALLEGKLDLVLAELQQGLASPEYETFRASLAGKLK